jgi:hypothetical protein
MPFLTHRKIQFISHRKNYFFELDPYTPLRTEKRHMTGEYLTHHSGLEHFFLCVCILLYTYHPTFGFH